MSAFLIVFIVILSLEFIAVMGSMTFSIVRDKRTPLSVKAEEVATAEETVEETEEIVEEEQEVAEAESEDADDDGEEESDEEAGVISVSSGDADSKRRIPFAEKMLYLDKKTQGYYNIIMNKFKGLRKINIRVSSKGVSYRLGRELVAKLTVRGKTMKLHLALDVNAYDAKIYFQKDLSAVKSYVEVPFAVKVKSDRGLKNALKLIDALVANKGIEEKTRFNETDGVEDLKAIAIKTRR